MTAAETRMGATERMAGCALEHVSGEKSHVREEKAHDGKSCHSVNVQAGKESRDAG